MTTVMDAIDTDDVAHDAAVSATSLFARAQRLRKAAAVLEAEAQAHAQAEGAPPFRTWAGVLHGDWAALREGADRVDAAESTSRARLGQAAAILAVVAALTGDDGGARTAAVRAETIASDEPGIRAGVMIARTVTWLARGNAGAAYATIADLYEQSPEGATRAGSDGLLAETAVLSHHEHDARRILHTRREAPEDAPAVEETQLALTLLCSERVDLAMQSALGDGSLRLPFARARLHLALGMWLRRHHSGADALRHVQIALDHFLALDAQPWIRAAKNELRASGIRQPRVDAPTLSDQQTRIVMLAARGLSNREIAAQMFLSPRTVGSHLYRIYPKLGISSRHQLASGLTALLRSGAIPQRPDDSHDGTDR